MAPTLSQMAVSDSYFITGGGEWLILHHRCGEWLLLHQRWRWVASTLLQMAVSGSYFTTDDGDWLLLCHRWRWVAPTSPQMTGSGSYFTTDDGEWLLLYHRWRWLVPTLPQMTVQVTLDGLVIRLRINRDDWLQGIQHSGFKKMWNAPFMVVFMLQIRISVHYAVKEWIYHKRTNVAGRTTIYLFPMVYFFHTY